MNNSQLQFPFNPLHSMSLDLHFLGNKLSTCRGLLQLSIEEVSQGTGIPIRRIKLFEQGKLEPLGDEILILSDFYKEDYKLFISSEQKSVIEKVDILYRRFGDTFTKDDRWAIREFLYLCECEEDVWRVLNFEKKNFDFQKRGDYFKTHGLEAAKELRTFLGYSDNSQLKDIFNDFRKIGVHVFRRKLSSSNISGLFILHPYAGKCVLVNYNEDTYRQNFTVAHEVGHSIFDSEEQINVSLSTDKGNDLRELRANTFAAHFLIPPKAISNLNVSQWSVTVLHNVAKQLRVNVTPLLIQLKNLKLISEQEYLTLKRNFINESLKEDFEFENLNAQQKENKRKLIENGLSTFYVRKCHDAFSNHLISRKRLAEMLLTDEFQLPNILSPFNLKLTYDAD